MPSLSINLSNKMCHYVTDNLQYNCSRKVLWYRLLYKQLVKEMKSSGVHHFLPAPPRPPLLT